MSATIMTSVAAPAQAAIASFSITWQVTNIRIVYDYSTSVPNGQISVTLTSVSDASKVWVLGLSEDTQTTSSATVYFDPKAIVNGDPANCALCVVSLISGPSSWLPNDNYSAQISFLSSSGGVETLAASYPVTTSAFTMPPSIRQVSVGNATSGRREIAVETNFSPAPTTVTGLAPRWTFQGLNSCSDQQVVVTATSPITALTWKRVVIDLASHTTATISTNLSTTASANFTSTTVGTLVRGCEYSVTIKALSSGRPPLPSDPSAPEFASNSLPSLKLPSYPDAPTAVLTQLNEGVQVDFSPPANTGMSPIAGYDFYAQQQVDGQPGTIVLKSCALQVSCKLEQAMNYGVPYKIYVRTYNEYGLRSAYQFIGDVTLDHCYSPPGSNIDWSGCDHRQENRSGIDFSGSNLSNANLSGFVVNNGNLSNANLAGANLSGANLENAIITGANLENTNFLGANFRGITGTGIQNGSTATLPRGWAIVNGTIGGISGPPSTVSVTRGDRKFTVE